MTLFSQQINLGSTRIHTPSSLLHKDTLIGLTKNDPDNAQVIVMRPTFPVPFPGLQQVWAKVRSKSELKAEKKLDESHPLKAGLVPLQTLPRTLGGTEPAGPHHGLHASPTCSWRPPRSALAATTDNKSHLERSIVTLVTYVGGSWFSVNKRWDALGRL